ncbi:uncharacterized protein J3D65DRAFT_197248 [Phyllosticta citribraziliensis]|uniref:Uncharacterized protein n=1 Tax=Phyllosticta citribraziliensis TaxID=989973 RepID=A0ABR1M379_9PEZI
MDELDDLVLIEDDDYMPSRPCLSRTASPTMCSVGHSSSSVSEKGTFDKDLDNGHVSYVDAPDMEPPSIPLPPAVGGFSPPPPPPSSESLAPTPQNDEPNTSSIGLPGDEPPPFSELVKEADEGDCMPTNDSVAGLQAGPQSRLNLPPKDCNYPITLHNGKSYNHVRRRRCGIRDDPPPPPPPPPAFWSTREDNARESATSEALSPGPSVHNSLHALPPVIDGLSGELPAYVCHRKRGPRLPGPPPPPPPFHCGPGPHHLPIPPPPPPPIVAPAAYSAMDLIRTRYWNQTPIERTLQLHQTNSILDPPRTGVLLHHRASPFDLHHWLWLLKYGEPEQWYTRPAEAELARLRRFEAKGLGSDVADLVAQGDGEERQPATCARTVKLWVGEVMGVTSPSPQHPGNSYSPFPDATQRRLENEFLVFYSIVEAPERQDDDELADGAADGEADEDEVRSRARSSCGEALAGGRKVYKVERTGNVDACLARAWHNATVNGWSTVFSCVVGGHVDLVQADQGMGVNGFERVNQLSQLVGDLQGSSGRTKIFY